MSRDPVCTDLRQRDESGETAAMGGPAGDGRQTSSLSRIGTTAAGLAGFLALPLLAFERGAKPPPSSRSGIKG